MTFKRAETRMIGCLEKKDLVLPILFLLAFLFSFTVHAQCIPGIPCVTAATPNDPTVSNDGPNISGQNASKAGSAACDADFMNQIYAEAFLHAERQMTINNIVIRKPDSVLEYSCFDQILARGGMVAPIFSESTDWQGRSVPIPGTINGSPPGPVTINVSFGPGKLQGDLQNIAGNAMSSFVGQNFSHDYLGNSAGIDYSYSGALNSAPYFCDQMNSIHFLAKCTDIGLEDQFFTFKQLTSLDPRTYPEACTRPVQITQGLIDLAANKNFAYVNFDPVSDTYIDRMLSGSCSDPIPTGVIVTQKRRQVDPYGNVTTRTNTFPEMVCVDPSCYYDGGGNCVEQ